MKCPFESRSLDLLLDYSSHRLDAGARAALEQHMHSCEACAAFRAGQAEVWGALDLWEAPPASQEFNRNLWRRIDEAAARPWYRSVAGALRHSWKPALPLAAAALLMSAGFLLDHRVSKDPRPGVSVNEAIQVEQTLEDIQFLRQLDVAPVAGKSQGGSAPMRM